MSIEAQTPSRRRTRLAPDRRRAEVLAAAHVVFVRDGFDAPTAAVAKQAGVTRGLVHHYFGSRRALLLAVLTELAERLPAAIRTDLDGEPLERMVAINAASLVDAVERDRDGWTRLLGIAESDPDVRAILDRAREEAIERMLRNQTTVLAASDELRLVLRAFLGAAEATLAEFTLYRRADRAQTETLLRETMLAMIGSVLPRLSAD